MTFSFEVFAAASAEARKELFGGVLPIHSSFGGRVSDQVDEDAARRRAGYHSCSRDSIIANNRGATAVQSTCDRPPVEATSGQPSAASST